MMDDLSINSADWLAYVAFCAWIGYPTGADAAVFAWQKARKESTAAAWARVADAVASQVSTLGHRRSDASRPKPAEFRLEPSEQETRLVCEEYAVEFCRRVYEETGGVTPDLRRAYQFFLDHYRGDDCTTRTPPPDSADRGKP